MVLQSKVRFTSERNRLGRNSPLRGARQCRSPQRTLTDDCTMVGLRPHTTLVSDWPRRPGKSLMLALQVNGSS